MLKLMGQVSRTGHPFVSRKVIHVVKPTRIVPFRLCFDDNCSSMIARLASFDCPWAFGQVISKVERFSVTIKISKNKLQEGTRPVAMLSAEVDTSALMTTPDCSKTLFRYGHWCDTLNFKKRLGLCVLRGR